MRKQLLFVFILFCYSLTCIAQVSNIDSIVMDEMEQQHIVGLSLGIVKDSKVMLSKGYGFASEKEKKPATENTVFKIGSLSKQFIATCIMILAEQDKLKLSDRIHKYYKDAPAEWGNISIRSLLNHTSGLERESPAFKWMQRQPDSVLIRAAYKDKLDFPTGTKWEYCNLGYFILADIIRQVTGESFEDYMNHFFMMNGLVHTVTTTQSNGGEKAEGYNYNKQSGEISEAVDFVALRPSGAFSSSMVDMIKWDSIQRTSNLLIPKDWTEMWEDTVRIGESANGTVSYYGYGWFVGKYKGRALVHHGGNTIGFTSEYWKLPDDHISIIILSNGNDVTLGKIAAKIATVLTH